MPTAWDDVEHLVDAVRNTITDFRLDRQRSQPRRLIIAVEAAGMLPQVVRITAPYGIPVQSSGGFDSLTAKHALAEFLDEWPAAEVLHIGDHDPSGMHVFSSLAEDVRAICADREHDVDVAFTRLAVTPMQITALGLPTAPPKSTDPRRFDGIETVQADPRRRALPPGGRQTAGRPLSVTVGTQLEALELCRTSDLEPLLRHTYRLGISGSFRRRRLWKIFRTSPLNDKGTLISGPACFSACFLPETY